MKKNRVRKKELDRAMDFLHNDPWGKRLLRIENTLTLMQKGMIPKFQKLVTNTSYDLREIVDDKSFGEAMNKDHESETDLISVLNNLSDSQAVSKARYNNYALQFFLYHTSNLEDNGRLYGAAFGQIIAATYAALGVDMSGFPAEIINPIKYQETKPPLTGKGKMPKPTKGLANKAPKRTKK